MRWLRKLFMCMHKNDLTADEIAVLKHVLCMLHNRCFPDSGKSYDKANLALWEAIIASDRPASLDESNLQEVMKMLADKLQPLTD